MCAYILLAEHSLFISVKQPRRRLLREKCAVLLFTLVKGEPQTHPCDTEHLITLVYYSGYNLQDVKSYDLIYSSHTYLCAGFQQMATMKFLELWMLPDSKSLHKVLCVKFLVVSTRQPSIYFLSNYLSVSLSLPCPTALSDINWHMTVTNDEG